MGVAAWTVPTVIGSMATPASALTTSTYCYQYTAGAGTCTSTAQTGTAPGSPGTSGCTFSPWPFTNPDSAVVVNTTCGGSPGVLGVCNQTVSTFTVKVEFSCRFTHAGGTKTNGNPRTLCNDFCTTSPRAVIQISPDGKTLTYRSCTASNECDQPWANFKFCLSCT